jgi:hypothetical protein
MNWLQIRQFGPYFNSFSTNIYDYYSQKSQNLFSNCQIFASAQIVRQAARAVSGVSSAALAKNTTTIWRPSFYRYDKDGHDRKGACCDTWL